MVKNLPGMQKTWVDPWVGNIAGGGHGNSLQYPSLENPHGQRSLAGCSPWESDTTEWVGTAHSTDHLKIMTVYFFLSWTWNILFLNTTEFNWLIFIIYLCSQGNLSTIFFLLSLWKKAYNLYLSGLLHSGRWEGRSGWGIHVNPWLIQVNVWQKTLQYCKVISLQLIKINGKKSSVFFLRISYI